MGHEHQRGSGYDRDINELAARACAPAAGRSRLRTAPPTPWSACARACGWRHEARTPRDLPPQAGQPAGRRGRSGRRREAARSGAQHAAHGPARWTKWSSSPSPQRAHGQQRGGRASPGCGGRWARTRADGWPVTIVPDAHYMARLHARLHHRRMPVWTIYRPITREYPGESGWRACTSSCRR